MLFENGPKNFIFPRDIYQNLVNSPIKIGHNKRWFGYIKRCSLYSKISGPDQNGHNKRLVTLSGGHIKRCLLYFSKNFDTFKGFSMKIL